MTIIICLAIGWVCMILYNLKKGYSLKDLLKYSGSGIMGARVVILTLCLVGILTGLWRSAGTIAYIVTISITLIQPKILLLCIFLLNSLVSFLIGTSFGTAATMGVICMILANSAGISPILSGGAVMSGIFFGDRCSPVSSSAVLVASVTKTDLYDNLKNMFLSARIPFGLSCVLYLISGFLYGKSGTEAIASLPDFSIEFELTAMTLIPAAAVLLLALFRVNVRASITISCVCAALICLLVQHQSPTFILHTILYGYEASHQEVAGLIGGGGLFSMKRVLCIICISATYSGIIKSTDLTEALTRLCEKFQKHFSRITCVTIVATLTAMIGCNQTLAIMLTGNFCQPMYKEEERNIFANDLEDTVITISALIPWCIAGAVPMAAIGAPISCLFAAVYLYLLPVNRMISGRDKPAI